MMHLPHLRDLPEAEIHAIADPAQNILTTVGERYSVPNRFQEHEQLIDELSAPLDAVLVSSPPRTHVDVATAALEAGLHTFVEKPLALTPAHADRLVSISERTEAVSMVGYMKRHEPTYLHMQKQVAGLDSINSVDMRLVLGQHDELVEEAFDLVKGEVSDSFLEESESERLSQLRAAIGTDDTALANQYHYHLSGSCHDLNALRGLLGEVTSIEYVDLHAEMQVLRAVLTFEGNVNCVFTSSRNDRKEWEEYIRVDTPNETLTIEFTNPYLRNNPFEVTRKYGTENVRNDSLSVAYEESFKCELKHFIHCIRTGDDVRTTFEEGRNDVARFAEMFRRVQEE